MTSISHTFKIVTSPPDAATSAVWLDLLDNAVMPTHYATPDFLVDPFAGQGERVAVLAMNGEQADAVVTAVKNGRSITAGFGVRPQTAFRRGIDRTATARALTDGLEQFAGTGCDLITIHSWEPLGAIDGYEHREASGADRVVMLDLAKGTDQLFREFSERRRTDVRKTMKLGLVSVKELEDETELTEVYDIHKAWTTSKGIRPDTREAFCSMLGSPYRTVLIAKHDGRIIAATYLRFFPGGVVEYAANNSLEEFQKLRANELLGWRAIELACERGFTHFSFGASHPFLARFGGETVASHSYTRDRSFLRVHRNRERLSRLAVRTYQSLPSSIRTRLRAAATRP